MKQVLVIIALFCSIICEVDIQEKRQIFADNIKSFVQDTKAPENWSDYVYNVQASASIILYGIKFSDINSVQEKFKLTDQLMSQIKAARFSSDSNIYSKLQSSVSFSTSRYGNDIGAAFREGEMVYFALIRAQAECSTKIKYEKTTREVCKRILFWDSCHDEDYYVPRGYTPEEIKIIEGYLDYRSVLTIKNYIPKLSQGDYQATISHGHVLYSPDGKSAVYFTDFGSMAIGPTSKLYVYTQPFKYYKYYNKESQELETRLAGNDHKIDCYVKDISTKEKECYTYMKGLYWKFNLVGRTISNYQRAVDRFKEIEKYKNSGTYLYEIKSNGNLIITNTRNNQIIWQSNTANKGVGPYNLELTNDRQLLLTDSKGDILFKSTSYNNIPSIDYKVYQNKEFRGFNGEIAGNTFITTGITKISALVYQYTNDTSLSLKYTVYNRYGSTTRYNGETAFISTEIETKTTIYPIEYVSFSLVKNTQYNICYSVFIKDEGWTDYGCNGELVGRIGSITYNKSLLGIMMFLTPKDVTLKKYSNIPAFLQVYS